MPLSIKTVNQSGIIRAVRTEYGEVQVFDGGLCQRLGRRDGRVQLFNFSSPSACYHHRHGESYQGTLALP